MSKTYYKVVKGVSTLESARPGINYPITYKIGEFVKPTLQGSKLFIFESLDHARKFKFCDEHIYECEATGVSKFGVFLHSNTSQCMNRLYLACKARRQKKKWSHFCQDIPPEGTLFADSVKLLRKVR